MSAPFRINPPYEFRSRDEAFRDYLSRLTKLIPAEIIGLYLIGNGFIHSQNHISTTVWAVICFIFLIISRLYGTMDPELDLPPQTLPVILSGIAFISWIYLIGGPFEAFNIHIKWLGAVFVLTISFLAPLIFDGN